MVEIGVMLRMVGFRAVVGLPVVRGPRVAHPAAGVRLHPFDLPLQLRGVAPPVVAVQIGDILSAARLEGASVVARDAGRGSIPIAYSNIILKKAY